MTQEDKELLLKDLCARLPYGVKMYHPSSGFILPLADIGNNGCITIGNNIIGYYAENIGYGCKPYLCPMSSMTEEEIEEYKTISIWGWVIESKVGRTDICPTIEGYDWLNAHHFDYRGLIKKGLAIEVTDKNNPYEN